MKEKSENRDLVAKNSLVESGVEKMIHGETHFLACPWAASDQGRLAVPPGPQSQVTARAPSLSPATAGGSAGRAHGQLPIGPDTDPLESAETALTLAGSK